MRNGFKIIIAALVVLVLALMVLPAFFDLAPKIAADAYVCGEPPDEVTYYCTPGTGPPRSDCSAPQTGEFDIDNTTIC
jgi:hypothetical protein